MLDIAQDIRSLTDFKRYSTELLEQLRQSGRPMVLTVNGRAELVVQDAASYQVVMDKLEAIEGIRRGLREAKLGKTRPAREVLSAIRRKHKIPRA
ncbi:MAG: type II toxin-antitoxin system Phd/YefM family antitoxin [Planctomycetes bacterium]|nr:type II toxin-antitoxin system Phd/YefM family antitoxin [Planctomycetota bacterium]